MREQPHLLPSAANHRPLTPVDFLLRAQVAFANRPAVAWAERTWSYAQFAAMVARFAEVLVQRGVGKGDVVSILAQNRPEMLAAHYAVPMVGGVLNTINTRLDPETIGYILEHSESRLLIADQAGRERAQAGMRISGRDVELLLLAETEAEASLPGTLYLLDAEPGGVLEVGDAISDEWQPICLNYTSGTTGRPKGVVYHHRGAYLNALGNVLALKLDEQSSYLWTLPMFHCNGWCHTWAVTAAGGLHVCLDRVDPGLILSEIARHGVTHMSCAPVVLYMLVNDPACATRQGAPRLTAVTGGAAPTSALIEQLDAVGFDLIHLYGLTESFGPATLCILDDEEIKADVPARAMLLARQGLRHHTAGIVQVADKAGNAVPHDGESVGEIVLSGNTVMSGYYRDEDATRTAFDGGVFHTGDLAVVHPDGSIQIKDRSKDVIISGGENISSLEVENALHQHPAVMLAGVVAAPHAKWGEVPVAFIELKQDMRAEAEEIIAFLRDKLAGFKIPRRFAFEELPKTSTGKIQKYLLRQRASDLVGESDAS